MIISAVFVVSLMIINLVFAFAVDELVRKVRKLSDYSRLVMFAILISPSLLTLPIYAIYTTLNK